MQIIRKNLNSIRKRYSCWRKGLIKTERPMYFLCCFKCCDTCSADIEFSPKLSLA